MVWVFGYDYNGQSGEYWNELYTYDKAWNDSSTSDTQKITGINTNNYWIQRYGVDFAPYRAMGWHDDGRVVEAGNVDPVAVRKLKTDTKVIPPNE